MIFFRSFVTARFRRTTPLFIAFLLRVCVFYTHPVCLFLSPFVTSSQRVCVFVYASTCLSVDEVVELRSLELVVDESWAYELQVASERQEW